MRRNIDLVLRRLEDLIASDKFEELETDALEIKPVPATGGDWKERHKSVNAFLNTRGGILVLGIKEDGQGSARRYRFTGFRADAENKISELASRFTTQDGRPIELRTAFPPPETVPFLNGSVALVFVDELPAQEKYVFLDGVAYKRVLTRDEKLSDSEIDAHEEYKQDLWQAREMHLVAGTTAHDIDLDRVNDYIQHLNRTTKIETIKASLDDAMPFLTRKKFLIGNQVTTLGMLVCGRHPIDYLGFRCQLHGYVDMPGVVAADKQDFSDNILPLMEAGFSYLLRNIQVGVSASGGGTEQPQYPEDLLRETVNNALAHRDYSIDRQVLLSIRPGQHISIQNPGTFRNSLLINDTTGPQKVLRILPEPKPRNPRLAQVLGVYRKWEGKGIGMATLVNLCLADNIDLPYYRLRQQEVALYICSGRLMDAAMERRLASFDQYIFRKCGGRELSVSQKLVLAYVMKSETANQLERHTILLTADNNHFAELTKLESFSLISRHPRSPLHYPIFLADRELMRDDYSLELQGLFGEGFSQLSNFYQDCLNVIYRHQHFSRNGVSNAKQAATFLWPQQGGRDDDIQGFDVFYRKVRYTFNRLVSNGFITRQPGRSKAEFLYTLNDRFLKDHLL